MGRWYRLPASQTGAVDSLARFGGIACSLRVRQAVIPNLRKLTAVPATQRVRGIPSEVPLDEDDGMPAACVLNFDSMIVLPKSWFVEPICQLSPIRMVQVCRALSVAMGC